MTTISRSEPCRCHANGCEALGVGSVDRPLFCSCWCHIPGAKLCGEHPPRDVGAQPCALPLGHDLGAAVRVHNDGATQWALGLVEVRPGQIPLPPPEWAKVAVAGRVDLRVPCDQCDALRDCFRVDGSVRCEIATARTRERAQQITAQLHETFRRECAAIEAQMLEQMRAEARELGIDLDAEPDPCPYCDTLHE